MEKRTGRYKNIDIERCIEEYKNLNLSIEEFCEISQLEKNVFIKWLNNSLKNYSFIPISSAIKNNYILFEEKDITNNPVCKIKIINYSIQKNEINYEYNEKYILKLELKFTNLKYFSTYGEEIFKKICILDGKYNIITRKLEDENGNCSECFNTSYYNLQFLPKIEYTLSVEYPLIYYNEEYNIAIKDYTVEGTGIKNITIENFVEKNKRNEKIKKIKCPNCGSLNNNKDGQKSGKQRYKCKECGKKFLGEIYLKL